MLITDYRLCIWLGAERQRKTDPKNTKADLNVSAKQLPYLPRCEAQCSDLPSIEFWGFMHSQLRPIPYIKFQPMPLMCTQEHVVLHISSRMSRVKVTGVSSPLGLCVFCCECMEPPPLVTVSHFCLSGRFGVENRLVAVCEWGSHPLPYCLLR